MTETVYVTRAQQMAARVLVDHFTATGQEVPPGYELIANAQPEDSEQETEPDDRPVT